MQYVIGRHVCPAAIPGLWGFQNPPGVQMADKLDLVVTLGGDGTVLWTGALLGTGPVPPLVSFALGSLGFMTPFPLDAMPFVLSSVRKQ